MVAIGVEAEGGHVYTVRETFRNKKKEEERTRKTKMKRIRNKQEKLWGYRLSHLNG